MNEEHQEVETAVQFLIDKICGEHTEAWKEEIQQAKEMEKQQRQKVDKLLDTLLENNMCSHAGDKLIEQFKTDNQ